MKRPFAITGLTVFFVTAFFFDFEIGVTATAFVMFAVSLVVSLLIKNTRKHGFLPVFFASAAVACALLIGAVNFTYLPVLSYDGMNNCVVRAQTTDFPEFRYGNCYVESRVISVNGEKTDFKARLVFSTPPEAEPYDIIEGSFNFYALGKSDGDLLQSYKSQGIFLGGYPVDEGCSVIEVPENEKPFAKKILDLRASIKNSVYRVLPDERGDLAVALIIGDQDRLSDEIYGDFKEIGISHVICVSGFHLSLWSMLVLNILKKTGIRQWLADILAGACVVVFMSVAGFTYSVIRAGVMMLVFLIGDIFMRRRDSLNSLGFALAFTAVINPFAMSSVSLKLSALATLGIILCNEYVYKNVNKLIRKIKFGFLRKAVNVFVSSVLLTVSATAFTLPVSLPLYGSFNYMCFIANLLIVPVAGWSMVLCSAGAFWGAVLPDVYNIFAKAGGALLNLIIKAADFLADYDFLTFRINEEKTVILLCGLFAFCVAAVFISYLSKRVYALASVLCVIVFTVSIVTLSGFEQRETKITVVECGNGMSVLISCNGENMLVGCGGDEFFGSNRISDAIYDSGGEINTAIIPDSNEKVSSYLYKIFAQYRPKRVFCDSLPDGIDLLLQGRDIQSFSAVSESENIYAESVVVNDCRCVYLRTDDLSALICFEPSFEYDNLPEHFKEPDVIISRSNFPNGARIVATGLFVLSAEDNRARNIEEIMIAERVRCVTTRNGDVVIRACDSNLSVNS